MAVKKLKETSSEKIVKVNVPGAPGFTQSKRTFKSLIPHPIQARRSIKTVIAFDPANAMTDGTAETLPGASGVTQPGRGGFKGGVRIQHQQPQVPPSPGARTRVVAPPSPTNKAGVRSPFNQRKRSAGSTIGKSKRFSR